MSDQKLNINLDGLRVELQRSLQKIIYLVSAGLNCTDGIEVEKLQLPTSIKYNFAKFSDLTEEKIKEKYSEWVLSSGFRDAIESVSSFLESVHQVLTCWELAVKEKSGFLIPKDDWNINIPAETKRYHRLGLPDKLDHIYVKHDIDIKDSFKEQILSINSARNCLVHRNGIVSERDVNQNEELVVKWLKMKLFVRDEDGDHDLVMGELIEKESTICVKLKEQERRFSLGSLVSFTVEEFSELTWCFFLFGEELVKTINQYGIDHGYVTTIKETNA